MAEDSGGQEFVVRALERRSQLLPFAIVDIVMLGENLVAFNETSNRQKAGQEARKRLQVMFDAARLIAGARDSRAQLAETLERHFKSCLDERKEIAGVWQRSLRTLQDGQLIARTVHAVSKVPYRIEQLGRRPTDGEIVKTVEAAKAAFFKTMPKDTSLQKAAGEMFDLCRSARARPLLTEMFRARRSMLHDLDRLLGSTDQVKKLISGTLEEISEPIRTFAGAGPFAHEDKLALVTAHGGMAEYMEIGRSLAGFMDAKRLSALAELGVPALTTAAAAAQTGALGPKVFDELMAAGDDLMPRLAVDVAETVSQSRLDQTDPPAFQAYVDEGRALFGEHFDLARSQPQDGMVQPLVAKPRSDDFLMNFVARFRNLSKMLGETGRLAALGDEEATAKGRAEDQRTVSLLAAYFATGFRLNCFPDGPDRETVKAGGPAAHDLMRLLRKEREDTPDVFTGVYGGLSRLSNDRWETLRVAGDIDGHWKAFWAYYEDVFAAEPHAVAWANGLMQAASVEAEIKEAKREAEEAKKRATQLVAAAQKAEEMAALAKQAYESAKDQARQAMYEAAVQARAKKLKEAARQAVQAAVEKRDHARGVMRDRERDARQKRFLATEAERFAMEFQGKLQHKEQRLRRIKAKGEGDRAAG